MRKYFVLLLIVGSVLSAQPLRKNVLSFAGGYVLGNASDNAKNSEQFLLWGNYLSSSLDEYSVALKKFSVSKNESVYKEDFIALKGFFNFFPLYFSASFGGLKGKFNQGDFQSNSNFYFLAVSSTYYHRLLFYSLKGKYVISKGLTKEEIYSGEMKVTWRPTKYYSFAFIPNLSQSSGDSNFVSLGLEFFWQPLPFFNISYYQYWGKRRFNFNDNYLILYNTPFTEQGGRSVYLRFYPISKLSLILNYEHRSYETFTQEYYSVSLRYDFAL